LLRYYFVSFFCHFFFLLQLRFPTPTGETTTTTTATVSHQNSVVWPEMFAVTIGAWCSFAISFLGFFFFFFLSWGPCLISDRFVDCLDRVGCPINYLAIKLMQTDGAICEETVKAGSKT